jgi:hypothetical protein
VSCTFPTLSTRPATAPVALSTGPDRHAAIGSADAAALITRVGEPFGVLVAVFEDVEQLCAQCIGLAERFEEVEAGYCRRMVPQIRFEELGVRGSRLPQLGRGVVCQQRDGSSCVTS